MKMYQYLGSLAILAAASTPLHLTAADVYEVDPVHSFILFKVQHMGIANVYGMFEEFEGTLTVDEETPTNSKVEITVKTASVDTNNAARDKHLVNPDFFNSTEFPTAMFTSTEVSKTGDNTYDITGDFTLLGVTKQVTVPFEFIGKGEGPDGGTRAGGEGTLTIKRSDFGMAYGVEGGMLGDETTLTIAIEGVLKK